MLVFRTQFPVSNETEVKTILLIGKTWIEKSPHSKIKDELTGITGEEDTFEASRDGESLILESYKSDELEIAGVKWTTVTDGFEWRATLVARKSATDFWISIELDSESNNPTLKMPAPKKPYIIKQILSACKPANDGTLVTNGLPYNLIESQIDIAAKIINGRLNNSMPIVYISSTFKTKTAINPSTLARFLYGIAHVVVEPSRQFSFRLRLDTQSQNAFGGSVGIYWPQGVGKEIIWRGDLPHDDFGEAIYNLIREAILAKRLKADCNWNYMEQLKVQAKIKDLKDSGSRNIEEYISAFDVEIKSKDRQIADAEEEIKKLKNELYKTSLKVTTQQSGELMNHGSEQELYDGEFVYQIHKLIEKEYDSSEMGTRKRDILKSLLDANQAGKEVEDLKEEIKSSFENYERMSPSLRSDIQEIGFTIQEEGKHFKLNFRGDERYSIVLPKTPSDHRTGKNMVRDINRMIF